LSKETLGVLKEMKDDYGCDGFKFIEFDAFGRKYIVKFHTWDGKLFTLLVERAEVGRVE